MKRSLSPLRGGFILAGLLFPALAQAHSNEFLAYDCASGLAHPVHGPDHLATMIAVGLWAAQLGGRARWLLPVTFLGMMALGAVLGSQGFLLPGVEPTIAASVLVLGLVIASTLRLHLGVSAGMIALFALAHGMAHGAEIPAGSSVWAYGAGFMAATAALHVLGLGAGAFLNRRHPALARTLGAACALTGLGLLLS